MKTWFKIWVLAVIGAFLFPNTAKLVHILQAKHGHHCEHAHHITTIYNSTKAFSIYNLHTDSHNCYICNFNYSGFKRSDKITVSVISLRYEEMETVHYLMNHSLPKYSSKQLRAPPLVA